MIIPRAQVIFVAASLPVLSVLGGAFGGSIVHRHLAQVAVVRVTPVTGGMQFEPIPGLDIVSLNQEVSFRASAALARAGVETSSDHTHDRVYIEVDHAPSSAHGPFFAVSVALVLVQPVVLSGDGKCSKTDVIWATTWEDRRLLLVKQDEVRERIIEAVVNEVNAFVGDIEVARDSARRPRQ